MENEEKRRISDTSHVTLIGYLGGDAVVRHVGDRAVISFSICQTFVHVKNGIQHEQSIWFSCGLWRDPQKVDIAAHLLKGVRVTMMGVIDGLNVYTDAKGF